MSPSSRRAWIEIVHFRREQHNAEVALLAEGVDRNRLRVNIVTVEERVALLAEGVDRNRRFPRRRAVRRRRPPRGGRG